jgi:hypothetical protein
MTAPRSTYGGTIYRYPAAPATVNLLPNSSMGGASAGSPGGLPASMVVTTAVGLVRSVVGSGIDGATGLPYVAIRLSGTASGTASLRIALVSTSELVVTPSTQYTLSYYVAMDAGSSSHIGSMAIQWDEYSTSGTAYQSTVNSGFAASGLTTTPVLKTLSGTVTASTTSINPQLIVSVTAGAVDATFRIVGAQTELGASRTTFQSTPIVALTHPTGGTVTGPGAGAPSQAAAAGFTNLVFEDDFKTNTTIATTGGATSGFKWYWDPTGVTSTSAFSVNTTAVPGVFDGAAAAPGASSGVLSLLTCGNNYSSALATVFRTQTAGSPGCWNHGYFEAYLQFSHTVTGAGGPSNGWPAFWLWSILAFGSNITNGQITAECDIMEYYPGGTAGATGSYITTLHNWQNSASAAAASDLFNNNYPNNVSNIQPSDNGWHKYGCLWQGNGTTGTVKMYCDDVLVTRNGSDTINLISSASSPTTGFTAQETQNMFIILGSATSGWPMNVDWVRVWQA